MKLVAIMLALATHGMEMGQAPNVVFGASPISVAGTEAPVRSQTERKGTGTELPVRSQSPFPDSDERLPARREYDFRQGWFDNEQLRLVGSGAVKLVRPAAEGLRVAIPAGAGPNEVGLAPKFLVRGDFEICASFEIIEAPTPDKGYGVGPAIYISALGKKKPAATLSRLKRVKEGDVYGTHRAWFAGRDGSQRQHRVRVFPTSATSGRLSLVRSGERLSYLVADGENEPFREIDQVDFTDGDLDLIRLALHRNGATTRGAIVWKDFDIHAEKIIQASAMPSHRWMLWAALVVVASLALGAIIWQWQRVRQR